MRLRKRIRLKERQTEQARLALAQNTDEFKRALHAHLASRTALALGFAGGWLLGWGRPRHGRRRQHGREVRQRATEATQRATRGMPAHWLRSYLIWPFVLATLRDYVVAHRPSRREV